MNKPKLGYVELPDYFTRILCANMQSGESNFKNLGAYIRSEPGFNSLVERCFKDIDEKLRVEVIIKSLGWFGFRNRMSAIFLEYQLNGEFPLSPNLELCNDLISLEDNVKAQTVEGFSRAFMLGLYLKLHSYKETNPFFDSFSWEDTLPLLKHSKARVIKIDWLLFVIIHLHAYLGKEVLRESLRAGHEYNELYEKLDESQKREYISNALSYGASINEAEFFYQSRV